MVYAERCTVALAASLANWQSSSGNFSPPESYRHRLLHASDRLIPAHSTHRQSAAQAALESISCLCGKERDMREVIQGAAEQCDFPRSELRFRALMEAFPAAAITCDTDRYITYFNRRSIALWGRAPKLHHADDRYCGSFRLYSPDGTPVPHDQCWMALALRDGKEYNGHEIMIERPDGSRWTALAHANPIYDETGEIAGAVNVLVDITDRKEAENLLREADRNKNEFLAMLAHELRNPLAPIRTGPQDHTAGRHQQHHRRRGAQDDGAPARTHGAAHRRFARLVAHHAAQDRTAAHAHLAPRRHAGCRGDQPPLHRGIGPSAHGHAADATRDR